MTSDQQEPTAQETVLATLAEITSTIPHVELWEMSINMHCADRPSGEMVLRVSPASAGARVRAAVEYAGYPHRDLPPEEGTAVLAVGPKAVAA